MLRRFEIYSIKDGVSPDEVARLERAFADCADFIPEVNHSVVGRNLSDQPIDVVWEHSYDSPEAYQRYMGHPYHASVLDRYLLNDSPERIVTDSVLGDGALVGYACDAPSYYLRKGVRKVTLMGLEGSADEQAAFAATIRRLADTEDEVALSVIEPNTMGVAWFDGITPILPPSPWTHVWELGFDSMDAYEAYQRGGTATARAERAGWKGDDAPPVVRAVELHYVVKG